MTDLVGAMARRFYEAAHLRLYRDAGADWLQLSQARRDGFCADMQAAINALRTLRPDVAAVLDAEVAALVEAARREEREACAVIADAGAPTKHWQDYHSEAAALRAEGQQDASEHIAAAIRARGAA